jgi:phospho-N-acetylmuramoyl-pentapeptide-transferase
MIDLNLVKLFFPVVLTFVVGMGVTPILTKYFYKYKLWKRNARNNDAVLMEGDKTNVNKHGVHREKISDEFKELNKRNDEELHTPRVGGMVIWVSILLTSALIFLIFVLFPSEATAKLEFISRNQTLLPFTALIIGSLVGLGDDLLVIFKEKGRFMHGFPRKYMISIVTVLSVVFGLWFFDKLGVTSISVPFLEMQLNLGWGIIPLFVLVTLGTFSSGVIDGIDGLAGGVMATIFSALSAIAFFQGQFDIAVLCAVVVAALLVFLWFNVPPARFYLGETGMLGLTMMLAVIVFLTDTVLLLPIIGLPLVVTSLSSFIQIMSKKLWGPGGKVFKIAPLHHHFEAVGWSRPKITMRYWIISIFCAVLGIVIALI